MSSLRNPEFSISLPNCVAFFFKYQILARWTHRHHSGLDRPRLQHRGHHHADEAAGPAQLPHDDDLLVHVGLWLPRALHLSLLATPAIHLLQGEPVHLHDPLRDPPGSNLLVRIMLFHGGTHDRKVIK